MPRKHGPVTVVRILEGEFGHPKMWTFGLTETDFVNIEKLIEESFKHPPMDYNSQAVRDRFAVAHSKGARSKLPLSLFAVHLLTCM